MKHVTALHFRCWLYLGAPVPATEEGPFQGVAQSQTLMPAFAIACPPLTAVGVKGNKADYIIWFVRYLNLDNMKNKVKHCKNKVKGQLLSPDDPGAPY